VYGEQKHEPKLKPSPDTARSVLAALNKDWSAVAGANLAQSTKPLCFSGRKLRRLVVAADPRVRPPWGAWDSKCVNPRAFTSFRKAINNAIAPLEVDDILFSTNRWKDGVL
jgi:hypothetical protein